MLQRKTEIRGLTFNQVDIFGCCLPSSDSIESVLVQIRDKRKMRKVCEYSNKIVPILYMNYELPVDLLSATVDNIVTENYRTGEISLDDIDKVLLVITGLQCKLSGDNFESYMQEEFVVRWFEALLGDFNLDTKKMREIAASILKHSSGNKQLGKKFGLEPEIPSKNMSNYPDYIKSKSHIQEFGRRISEISGYDVRMFLLIIASVKIMNEFFKISDRAITTTHKIFCSECQNYFTTNRRPVSKICGSCQKKSQEQKKVSRRRDVRKDFNGIGNCKECENKRNLNTDGICRSCHEKNDLKK